MEKALSEALKEMGFELAGPDYARGRFPIASGKYGHQTLRPLETDKPVFKHTAAIDEKGFVWTKREIVNLSARGFTCETAPLAVELAVVLEPLGFEAIGDRSDHAHQYFVQRTGDAIRTIAYDERGNMYAAVGEIHPPNDLLTLMN